MHHKQYKTVQKQFYSFPLNFALFLNKIKEPYSDTIMDHFKNNRLFKDRVHPKMKLHRKFKLPRDSQNANFSRSEKVLQN